MCAVNPIRPREIRLDPQVVPVYYERDNTITEGGYNTILAYLVSRFYAENTHHDIERKRLLMLWL